MSVVRSLPGWGFVQQLGVNLLVRPGGSLVLFRSRHRTFPHRRLEQAMSILYVNICRRPYVYTLWCLSLTMRNANMCLCVFSLIYTCAGVREVRLLKRTLYRYILRDTIAKNHVLATYVSFGIDDSESLRT